MEAEREMSFSKRTFTAFMLVVAFILSIVALTPRWKVEKENRNSGIILEYRDVLSLASKGRQTPEAVFNRLTNAGVSGLIVAEMTGKDLSAGLVPLYYGTVADLPDSLGEGLDEPYGSATIWLAKGMKGIEWYDTVLQTRFPDSRRYQKENGILYVLPHTIDELLETGVVPDFAGLLFALSAGIPVMYRVAPVAVSDTENEMALLEALLDDFPSVIRCVSPSGLFAAGYPDMRPLANVLKEAGIPVAMVEFSRQLGAQQLNWLLYPDLLPLHSVTTEEMISRNISRNTLYERMVRAAKERGVRLLLMRPTLYEASSDPLGDFEEEVQSLSQGLSERGIVVQWPETFSGWNMSFLGAVGCALIFLLLVARLADRFLLLNLSFLGSVQIVAFIVIGAFLGVGMWKISFAARLVGALTAAFLAAEATFIALEEWKKPLRGILGGFIVAVIGGLALAALFSFPVFMLRLRAFSGVKATLFLPPLIVLLYDLRRRVHPESLGQVLARPPLWGELFLIGVLLVGAAVTLLRSGNAQFVPGWEVTLRDTLERLLVARPRNKELFAGYPALLFWYYFKRRNLWERYREIFRLGATLAFCSLVNSFCHFHTPLYFILWRQFNGWWTGILLGAILLALFHWVCIPFWKRWRGVIMD